MSQKNVSLIIIYFLEDSYARHAEFSAHSHSQMQQKMELPQKRPNQA